MGNDKNEFRLRIICIEKMRMNSVGIDVSKRRSMIAVMRPFGEVVCSPFFQPRKVRLKLFFRWGIQFREPYTAPERGNRKVAYANKVELVEAILAKYPPPPAAKQKKRAGHGKPSWGEAAMGKKSSLPERRPLRMGPPGENQGRE